MSEVQAKPAVRDRIEERAKAGKCIIQTCDAGHHTRGLCQRHYQEFLREQKARKEDEQPEFETNCIREGLILKQHAISGITEPSPFANI